MSEVTVERSVEEIVSKPPLCMNLEVWPSGKIWVCASADGHAPGKHYYQRLNS